MTTADGVTQPHGWSERALYADDNAPHQIRVTGDGAGLFVSCTCRSYRRELHGTDEIGRATEIYRTEHADAATEVRNTA